MQEVTEKEQKSQEALDRFKELHDLFSLPSGEEFENAQSEIHTVLKVDSSIIPKLKGKIAAAELLSQRLDQLSQLIVQEKRHDIMAQLKKKLKELKLDYPRVEVNTETIRTEMEKLNSQIKDIKWPPTDLETLKTAFMDLEDLLDDLQDLHAEIETRNTVYETFAALQEKIKVLPQDLKDAEYNRLAAINTQAEDIAKLMDQPERLEPEEVEKIKMALLEFKKYDESLDSLKSRHKAQDAS